MKLVMTMLVRDEEDIVAHTVGFHLDRGVDLVLVTDNGSLDGTRDALAPFERDGVLRVIDEPGDDYQQSEWVTRMARAAACEHSADWVLHCDADEFWWADADLRTVLAAVPPSDGVVFAPRQNFVSSASDGDAPFYRRMTVRDTQSRNALGVPLFAKCAHRAHRDVVVAQGNHIAEAAGLTTSNVLLDATVMHFPVRSYAQFERKVVLGGRAYARNRDLPWTTGNTWRVLYDSYLDGRLPERFAGLVPTPAQVHERLAAGRYVVDERLSAVLSGAAHRDGGASVAEERPPPAVASPKRPPTPARVGPARVEVVLWHPEAGVDGRVEAHLVDVIDAATTRLDVAAQVVEACAVLAALDTARRRGVDVRILTADATPLASWRLSALVRPGLGRAGGPFVLRDGISTWIGLTSLRRDDLDTGPAAAVHIDDPIVTARFTAAFDSAWRSDGHPDEETAGSGREPVGLADGEMFTAIGADDHRRVVEELLAVARRVRRSHDPCRPLLILDDATVVTGALGVVPTPNLPAVTLVVRSRTVAAALRPFIADGASPAATLATLSAPEEET